MLKDNIAKRMSNIVLMDKVTSLDTVVRVMRSDIYCVLANFLDIQLEDIHITMDNLTSGEYEINILAQTARIFNIGKSID